LTPRGEKIPASRGRAAGRVALSIPEPPTPVRYSLHLVWERLRSHILFVPGVLTVLAILLAIAMVETDRRLDTEEIREFRWIFRAGASGARDVLSTIATAMVQMAAITFSVTIVSLSLRSQQFGPRLLRNFTADQVNQAILGVFIGTFAYCLLVLRAVRDLDDPAIEESTFVPLLAVTFGIGLALLSLALFVVFIDRIVTSIQPNSIIAQAAKETHGSIDDLFPEPVGEGPDAEDEEISHLQFDRPVEVMAAESGYIQSLHAGALMEVACDADLLLRMEAPIGGFVVKGTPIATASPREHVDDKIISKIQKAYTVRRDRSVKFDPEFGVRQIVDVAVKALSPSDNDPTTAGTAIEYLGALLIDFATRSLPSRLRRDDEGEVRVLAVGPTFRSMADLALNQIREHGADDVAATQKLLETVIRVAGAVEVGSRRAVLVEHLWKISRSADRGIKDPLDRAAVNRLLQRAMERLGKEDSGMLHYLIPLNADGARVAGNER
jgi:uncharacterized membrane protein